MKPVSARPIRNIDLALPPVEVARRLAATEHDLVFLDSSNDIGASYSQPNANFSLIAAGPREIITGKIHCASDLARLRSSFKHHALAETEAMDLGYPVGGAFGSIDYDGSFRFGMYRDTLIFDHRQGQWQETGENRLAGNLPPEPMSGDPSKIELVPAMDKAAYCSMVEQAREYIAAGDIYQVNLSQRFAGAFSGDAHEAFTLYERLRAASPAPYAAYLGGGKRRVLSSSPELFLSLSGNTIRTRPIKGTRPRFADSEADEKSAYDLRTSPKEIAELIMITDLERNDLGQICEYGSVEATDLLKLERYEQVFHLVSTVEGILRDEIDAFSALAACYPGGSITGAPKKRAREIIAELEPEPRGLYTGVIGGFGFNGESRFNIAIRTAIVENDEFHFHTGAGIVTDSNPEAEYEETLHKAAGIVLACS